MLFVHRSQRADALVGPLAEVLAEALDDPFTPDVVAVPTRGVERWLAQRLSHRLGAADGEAGVCANVRFDPPRRLVGEILATVLEVDADADPWQADRLTWTVLALLDDCAGEPWCRSLGRHLGVDADPDDPRRGRRVALAQRLTRLFDAYAAQRPTLLLDWSAGHDTDGAGAGLPDELDWQPELWRRLRDHVGVPSPAERLTQAVTLCRQAPERLSLPPRLSVFGATRLPVAQLQVLAAVAEHRDVHLWLPHPSPVLWERVRALPVRSRRRRDAPIAARFPLLASMARDASELEAQLLGYEPGVDDRHHPAAELPDSLLGELQRRLRDDDSDRVPAVLPDGDRSVQVHACHGRARQVEVLREVLLGLFADDPALEPRDVIVLCPDIESFAPLLAATFGAATDADDGDRTHPGHLLRVRLADRAVRRTNPSLALLATLLELADGRVTASQVLDLAATEPVRRRFGFRDDDLDRLRQWAVSGHARWGEDAGRRARFGLADVRDGTWSAALDRLLLGVAMTEDGLRSVGTAFPLEDVDSTEIDLAGRLAELLDRLARVLRALDGPQPLDAWLDALRLALELLTAPGASAGWQDAQAREALAAIAASGGGRTELRLPDVRALLADAFEPRPTRTGFRTGALTVCTLEPMRAVPHRVVCLLGIDDGVFPRHPAPDGDDVLQQDPCVGERDRRSEDRQLFLDAICSAGERLIVLYTGADERTGAERPPAVPVAELLDALDRVASTRDGAPVRTRVQVRQPLQPVDERNFAPGELGRDAAFSFDAAAHVAAVAARAQRRPVPPFLPAPLDAPVDEPGEIDLEDLVRAVEHPAKWFLRSRLGLTLAGDDPDVDDRVPLALDSLQQWAVGDRMLAACLDGIPREQAFRAERLRGELPPGRLATAVLSQVDSFVVPVAQAAQAARVGAPTAVDVAVALGGGRRLTGTVQGVYGDVVVRAEYSKLAPKHRLRAWVQLLALTATFPQRPWQAVTIGRVDTRVPGMCSSVLSTPSPGHARSWLAELTDVYARALREPLPLPVAPACDYAARRRGAAPEQQAFDEAARRWRRDHLHEDVHHIRCWGKDASLRAIAGQAAGDEQAWWPDEPTRFGVLSRRVWDPLLRHEHLQQRRASS